MLLLTTAQFSGLTSNISNHWAEATIYFATDPDSNTVVGPDPTQSDAFSRPRIFTRQIFFFNPSKNS